MAGARVESLEALKSFRLALFKFAESAGVALGDAESEIHRTLRWLDTEQLTYWQGQIRKRMELLARAQDALRQKTLYKDATGRQQSAVDEMKAVAQCKRRLEEAHQKLGNVKLYSRRLQKELETYKGTVQRFATVVQSDVPRYAAKVDRMVSTLQAYTELTADDISAAAAGQFSSELSRSSAQARGYGAAATGEAPAAAARLQHGEVVQLRRLTPPTDVLAAAAPGLAATSGWKAPPVQAIDNAALAAMNVERDPPAADLRIIVRRDYLQSRTIYLERLTASSAADSGWYVGPARTADALQTADVSAVEALRVSDLLAVRPDFRELLSLPRGYLVVVGEGGIQTVLDPHDQDVWISTASRPKAVVSDLNVSDQ